MKVIKTTTIAGLALVSTAFMPAASANELTTAVTDVALEVAEEVATDIKESSVRQLEQMWASLQSVVTESEESE